LLSAGAVLAVFWFIAADLGMGFLPAEYAIWKARHQLVADCKLSPTIILGDSRAAAGLLPSRIKGATNLALGGGTPVEMYYISKDILKCPRTARRVIISMSPGQAVSSSYFWDRTGLYGVLTFDDLEEIRLRSRALNDTNIYGPPKFGDLDAVIGNVLHAVDFPSYDTSYIIRHYVIGRLRDNRKVAAETLAANGQHYYGGENGSDGIADDAKLTRFVPSALLGEYFGRMLDDYEAHGIGVYFIGVPMNEATYDRMNPDVINGFQAYLVSLAAAHPNFKVIGSAVASLDNRYFGDSTHLNAKGAELVSQKVGALFVAERDDMRSEAQSRVFSDAD